MEGLEDGGVAAAAIGKKDLIVSAMESVSKEGGRKVLPSLPPSPPPTPKLKAVERAGSATATGLLLDSPMVCSAERS